MTVDIGIAQSHVPFRNKPVHNAMGAVDRNRFREVRSDVYLPTAVDQQQPSFEVDRTRLNSRWGIWKLAGRVIRHGESFEDFGLFASPRRHQWWRPATWPISQQIKLASQWYRSGVKEKVAETTPEQRAQFSVTALLAQQERYEVYITAILEAKTDVLLHPAEVRAYLEGLVELYPNLPVDLTDLVENADTLDTQQTAFSALRAAQEGPPGGSEEHPQEEVVEARVDAVLQDAVPTIFPNAPQDDLRGKSKAVDEALQDTTQEELAASLGEQPSLVDTDAESKSVGLPDAETEAPAFDEQVNRKDRDNVLAELKEDGAFNHMTESWRKQFITDLEQGGLTYKELGDALEVSVQDSGIGIPDEHLPFIFDRFYRVENKVHTVKGTGLGLHLVKIAIEKHHAGEVFVKSEIGTGSTFGFRIPLGEPGSGLPLLSSSTSKASV